MTDWNACAMFAKLFMADLGTYNLQLLNPLGIEDEKTLANHQMRGPLFENFTVR